MLYSQKKKLFKYSFLVSEAILLRRYLDECFHPLLGFLKGFYRYFCSNNPCSIEIFVDNDLRVEMESRMSG